jgi:uncharacterized coiled-coil protein SlyX
MKNELPFDAERLKELEERSKVNDAMMEELARILKCSPKDVGKQLTKTIKRLDMIIEIFNKYDKDSA